MSRPAAASVNCEIRRYACDAVLELDQAAGFVGVGSRPYEQTAVKEHCPGSPGAQDSAFARDTFPHRR